MKSVVAGGLLVLAGCSQGEVPSGDVAKSSSALAGPTTWGLAQTLVPQGTARIEALAASDTTLLVGARGAAYVYVRDSASKWTLEQTLVTNDDYEVNEFPEQYTQSGEFGGSVALSGDTALIGCSHCIARGVRSGSVYVYVRSGQTFTLQQVLNASGEQAEDKFGLAVALDGDNALVTSAKGAHVFVRSGSTWTQQATLSLPTTGTAAAISGDLAAVVSNTNPAFKTPTSAAYLFTRSASDWGLPVELSRDKGEALVAIAGGRVIVSNWEYYGFPYDSRFASTATFTTSGVRASVTFAGGPDLAAVGDSVLLSTDSLNRLGNEDREPTNLSPAVLYPGDGLPAYNFATVAFSTHLAMSDSVIAFAHDDGSVTLLTKYVEPEATCRVDTDCVSGHCVEGLCCDTACGRDSCQACSAARKGHGADGICDWIASDTQTACGEAHCGIQTPFMTESQSVVEGFACKDGIGCRPAATVQNCEPYLCNPQTLSCNTSCTSDSDCHHPDLGYRCVAAKCTQGPGPTPSTGGAASGGTSATGGTPSAGGSNGLTGGEASTGGEVSAMGGAASDGTGGKTIKTVPPNERVVRDDTSPSSQGCSVQRGSRSGGGQWLLLAALLAGFRRRAFRAVDREHLPRC